MPAAFRLRCISCRSAVHVSRGISLSQEAILAAQSDERRPMEPEICLSGKDALRAWREVRRRVNASNAGDPDDPAFQPLLVRMLRELTTQFDLKALPAPVPGVALPEVLTAASIQAACRRGLLSGSAPELLVSSSSARRYVSGVRPRVFGYELPEGSLCRLGEGVLIPSPGLMVLLLARELGVAELSMLLCELCGFYCLDPSLEQGFLNAPPLQILGRLPAFSMTSNPSRRLRESGLLLVLPSSVGPLGLPSSGRRLLLSRPAPCSSAFLGCGVATGFPNQP